MRRLGSSSSTTAERAHNASLKYNTPRTHARRNGTFEWIPGHAAPTPSRRISHAGNGSLVSHLSNPRHAVSFSARARRPAAIVLRSNDSGQNRPFPTPDGFRLRLSLRNALFIPVDPTTRRIQILDNVSLIRGNHLFKTGFEWNRTKRIRHSWVCERKIHLQLGNGFINYVNQGNGYVECSNAAGVVTTTTTQAFAHLT